jgi:hypothetical protein
MVLGIVLLLAVAAGSYWLGTQKSIPAAKPSQPTLLPTKAVIATPTIDSTVGWKTYRDMNLSFKYPPDYVVSKTQIRGVIRIASSNRDELPAIGNLDYEMKIDYLDNPKGLNLEQWFEKEIEELKQTSRGLSVAGKKKIKIGDSTGEQVVFNYGGGFIPDVYTFVMNDAKVLRVSFSKGSPDFPSTQSQESIFNQILGTFRFLD